MTSKIFTARNNLTIDGNFSPNIIFVRSSNTNTTITITIADSVNADEIFMVKCFTTTTIITSSWTTTLQSNSCIAFTRLNIISAQPVRVGESVAVALMSNQSVTVNTSATIAHINDSASEIGMPSAIACAASMQLRSFVYHSATGGLLIAQIFISRAGLTSTNSVLHIANYPNIPGIDGNANEASLVPTLTSNSTVFYGIPFECSASSEFSSIYEAYNVFTPVNSWYTAGRTTGWVQVKLPFAVVVDRFDISSAIWSPDTEKFTKWEILGSNDGATFKRLFYSNSPVSKTFTRFYFTENIAPYMFYRFNGLEGIGVNCGLSDLQFYAKSPPIELLNTSPFVRNDGYTISKTIALNMPANIPVYFWFTSPSWPAGNFTGYCIIRK